MDGSFCGFTADESCGGTSRGVGGPACLRDGGGSVASSFSFHKPVISSCANEAFVRGLPCGKRVRWLGWSRLTDLARPQNFKFAEKHQGKVSTIFRSPARLTQT